ncbi:hypothetical protein C4D60_Mb00t00760 [Musa balbisiana]|uniref:Uncharacterized protein n=1 Tax=Musa balbisiana TaxID=52838 RepID=A0A4S8I6B8_MUSBA|nr:hypothetical protein C4D60_Mb00t00760 [Musa balbisiana]
MVRLVFRPIPKSDERFARQYRFGPSTRVSSGFASLRHSSPSFGSRHACSNSNPSQKIRSAAVQPLEGSRPSASLCLPGFRHPSTRTHVRLPWSVFQDGSDGEPTGRCLGSRVYPAGHADGARHVLDRIDALDGIYRPIGAAFQTTRLVDSASWCDRVEPDGALTLPGAPFQGTWARSVAEDASPDYNSDDAAARFSSWA